nr:hypothetical protein [Treponemataceae bacterium]
MAKTIVDKAQGYLRKRQFTKVIRILEPQVIEYRDSFRFFYILGVSCLYLNDIQGAEAYFKRARQLKINDVNLILAQAVIFLRHGKIKEALEYALDARDIEPNNRYVLNFIEMIRRYGEPEIISEWSHNGKLRKYYPPLPKRFNFPAFFISICVISCAIFVTLITVNIKKQNARLNIDEYAISDKSDMIDRSMSRVYRYILTMSDAESYYKKAQKAINDYDDNQAQKYINIILNSNCSEYVQTKALTMESILVAPTFESKFTGIYLFELPSK